MDKSKDKISYPPGKHPNSLAALTHCWDTPEKARAAQLKGAKVRTANKILREELKMNLKLWKEAINDLEEFQLDSVDALRMIASQKLKDGNLDGAAEIYKSIAEFEKPKLQRVENKVEQISAESLSDEEIAEKLKELKK